MKLEQVTVTYSRTVSPIPYHFTKSEITVTATLEDGDDAKLATVGLREMARNHVMVELGRTNEKLAEKVKDVYLGLPAAFRETLEGEKQDAN